MRRLLTLTVVVWMASGSALHAGPKLPFPQHVRYPGATVRLAAVPQDTQDADVRNAWRDWKGRYLVALPSGEYRVAAGSKGKDQARTVSEGQGYGLVLAALMAGADAEAQAIFDGLWRYSRAHPSTMTPKLMAWQVPTAKGDADDSAFDGDADIAYALLMADAQWGSTGGAVNYLKEGLEVIQAIRSATIGKQSHLPLLGDWINSPGAKHTEWHTRSSDFVYGHFRAFRNATGDATWDEVLKTTQGVVTSLQHAESIKTGLLPDFIIVNDQPPHKPRPAPPKMLEDKNDGAFYYNACRDPWRLGTDALITGDATSLAQVRKMSEWIVKAAGGDPEKLRAGYALDGKPVQGSNFFTTVFVAPWGVAAMTCSGQEDWLNKIYMAVREKREEYFEDSVALLSMLVMTQNFWEVPKRP